MGQTVKFAASPLIVRQTARVIGGHVLVTCPPITVFHQKNLLTQPIEIIH